MHYQCTTLTKPTIHVNKTIILVMQLTVFQQSPELHTCHDISIVRIELMTQSTVECIHTVKAGHMTQHHK